MGLSIECSLIRVSTGLPLALLTNIRLGWKMANSDYCTIKLFKVFVNTRVLFAGDSHFLPSLIFSGKPLEWSPIRGSTWLALSLLKHLNRVDRALITASHLHPSLILVGNPESL